MNKIFLPAFVLILFCQSADAGILGILNNNNGYYYPNNNVRYSNGCYYHPQRYYPNYYNNANRHYHRYYPHQNYYYNQQPVIFRNEVRRKSISDINEKTVSSQTSLIDSLEKQLFNQTFDYDNSSTRIERLERKLFGASQSGTEEERLFVLKSAAKNYKAFTPDNTYQPQYNAYRPPIFMGSTGSNWKNMLWGNFRNQFAGTPTGFTPAMDPAFMDYFEAERAMMGNGDSVDYRSNTGYYSSNTNRGSKTGVTILDWLSV